MTEQREKWEITSFGMKVGIGFAAGATSLLWSLSGIVYLLTGEGGGGNAWVMRWAPPLFGGGLGAAFITLNLIFYTKYDDVVPGVERAWKAVVEKH
ncbi:MAG: hypothetical protein Q8R13_02220 [bacterium]|nr:hypothetical protein [bacterium]MDZ4296032.1 hypothetical protein [Patescibacteria group bacterium]